MSAYSPLQLALAAWAAVAIVYAVLFLYRSIVGMKEEEILHLSDAGSQADQEQHHVMQRIRKVESLTRIFGIATLAMTVVLAVIWGYGAYRQLF